MFRAIPWMFTLAVMGAALLTGCASSGDTEKTPTAGPEPCQGRELIEQDCPPGYDDEEQARAFRGDGANEPDRNPGPDYTMKARLEDRGPGIRDVGLYVYPPVEEPEPGDWGPATAPAPTPTATVAPPTKPPPPPIPETAILILGPFKTRCQGFIEQDCFYTYYEDVRRWGYFFEAVQGLEYEPGFIYTLKVWLEDRGPEIQDVGRYAYHLVETLSKKPAPDDWDPATAPAP